jgi:fructose-specific phosphotransferase system component IIB
MPYRMVRASHVYAKKTTVEKAKEMNKNMTIKMNKKDFIKEHKKLINLLENGTKKQLKKEADSQKKEMKKYNIKL